MQPFGRQSGCSPFPTCNSGTGRTGYMAVPPNNYPFYSEDEKYVPIMQADGGQLSGTDPSSLGGRDRSIPWMLTGAPLVQQILRGAAELNFVQSNAVRGFNRHALS